MTLHDLTTFKHILIFFYEFMICKILMIWHGFKNLTGFQRFQILITILRMFNDLIAFDKILNVHYDFKNLK